MNGISARLSGNFFWRLCLTFAEAANHVVGAIDAAQYCIASALIF